MADKTPPPAPGYEDALRAARDALTDFRDCFPVPMYGVAKEDQRWQARAIDGGKKALAVVEAALTAATPAPAPAAPTPMAVEFADRMAKTIKSMPINDGELWSWTRSVMSQGAGIHQDYAAGGPRGDAGYEAYSARLDAAASKRADELMARIASPAPAPAQPLGSAEQLPARPCRCGPDGCADSGCPGKVAPSGWGEFDKLVSQIKAEHPGEWASAVAWAKAAIASPVAGHAEPAWRDVVEHAATELEELDEETAQAQATALRELLDRGPQAPQQAEYQHEAMDAIAANRYKVSRDSGSMLGPWAVRAGDGEKILYHGSKSDCEAVARRLTGAFLDGGFVAWQIYTAPQAQPAETMQQKNERTAVAAELEQLRTAARLVAESTPETLPLAIDALRDHLGMEQPKADEPVRYCWSHDEERYFGDLPSREDAVGAALDSLVADEVGEPGELWTVHTAVVKPALSFLRPKADRIGEDLIERLEEWLYDDIASDDEIIDFPKDKHAALGNAALDFLAAHAKFTRYGVADVEDHEVVLFDVQVTGSSQ